MAVKVRTKRQDPHLRQIVQVLKQYNDAQPGASIDVYRYSDVSIRIRVIDPAFEGQNRADREDVLWKYLERIPEDVASEISFLLMLTPKEAEKSFANVEFDNPVPSRL